jgi:hypothetical protein
VQSNAAFAGPKYSEPKMASHDLRAGSAKYRCLCSIVTWTSSATNMDAFPSSCFPLPASLFPAVARQSATHLLAQPSFHFLSPLEDHLPPSRFWLSFLSSASLSSPFCPSSSPPQAGCHRYNPSKVALHPTVRSLPTCLVETRTCLCRMINCQTE